MLDRLDAALFAFAGLSVIWLAYLLVREGVRPGWPLLLRGTDVVGILPNREPLIRPVCAVQPDNTTNGPRARDRAGRYR